MKRVGKPVSIILTVFIITLSVLSITGISSYFGDKRDVHIKGVKDIRWGIDINGGLDVTFSAPEGYDATKEEMEAAESVINLRLLNLNITDSEVYIDENTDSIIVRFPWKSGEENFDPEKAVQELGETAMLFFREGTAKDSNNYPDPQEEDAVVLKGTQVKSASASYGQTKENGGYEYYVSLELEDDGKQAFADATTRLANVGYISIWMDSTIISAPSVNSAITDGKAIISGNFDAASAKSLADKINAGSLPFKLEMSSFRTISASLGQGALRVMTTSAVIAFVLICIMMIAIYRLPGIVSCIALLGQIAGSLIAVSGFFPVFDSFTLTIPGMAGIILSIGMGVDANIISAERIKDEIRAGKTIDGAISLGFQKAFSAIFDGNITAIIVAIVLLGAFGPTDSLFAKILSPFFFMFGPATTGEVYSFGYTLLAGVIMNFVMGVTATRLILKSISRFGGLRKLSYYVGRSK